MKRHITLCLVLLLACFGLIIVSVGVATRQFHRQSPYYRIWGDRVELYDVTRANILELTNCIERENVRCVEISVPRLAALARLGQHLPLIENVEVRGDDNTPLDLGDLAVFPWLRELELYDLNVSQQEAPNPIRFIANLSRVCWVDTNVTQAVIGICNPTQLNEILVRRGAVCDEVNLDRFVNLRSVDCRESGHVKKLMGTEWFRRVETIDFSDTDVSDSDVLRWSEYFKPTNLEEAAFRNTAISSKCATVLRGCKSLRRLDLGQSRVDDTMLSALQDLPRLIELKLDGSQVSETGLRSFLQARTETSDTITIQIESKKRGNLVEEMGNSVHWNE